VVAVGLLLAVAVAIAVVVLYVLIFSGLRANIASLESLSTLQLALQNVFGGVLLVLLGLELIDTLRIYFIDHHIRTEVILVVAMIAVGRHIIQIDFEHTGGFELIGMAAITVALAVSYFLVKRARTQPDEAPPGTTPERHSALTNEDAERSPDTRPIAPESPREGVQSFPNRLVGRPNGRASGLFVIRGTQPSGQ
jgi:uncharacterized membrane protein (DUF373 family)